MTDELRLPVLAYKNGIAAIRRLIDSATVDVNAANREGFTALHVAAQEGYVQLVTVLLAFEASPNARTADGHTPLFMVVGCPRSRQVQMAALLTHNGASRRARNKQNIIAYDYLNTLGTDDLRNWLNPDS